MATEENRRNRYVKLQLKYGSNFNQLNLTHPSIIKVANSVNAGYKHGDRYIVGPVPNDEFLTAVANDIATFDSSVNEWVFFKPYIGMEVIDIDNKTLKKFNGTEWVDIFTFIPPAGEIAADITGNAGTATKLKTARMITISGGANGQGQSFDGTESITFDTYLDLSKVTEGILAKEYGGTGNKLNKTDALVTPIKFAISGGVIGTSSSVDLSSDVTIPISIIDADKINTGTLAVARGGTGRNVLTGMLKGNGTSGILTATANVDYTTPSGSITGNAATATKLQVARTIKLTNDIVGEVETDFSGNTEIVTSFNGVISVAKGGTGATDAAGARENLEAAYEGHHHVTADIDDFDNTTLEILKKVYPVGSFYTTSSDDNPADIFGFGGWTKVQDRFLLGSGTTYKNKDTGGSAYLQAHNHSITINGNGNHTHSISGSTNGGGNHTHTAGNMHIKATWYSAWEDCTPSMKDSTGALTTGTCGLQGEIDGRGSWTCLTRSFDAYEDHGWTGSTSNPGNHTHTISLTCGSSGYHSHSASVGSSGSGNAQNMPPYLVVNIWQRIS